MASNIPLGTYVSDGVRTGPLYNGQLPQGFVSDNNGVITSSSGDIYGPGILLSSQNTWNITPAEPNGVAGFTTLNNLVAATAVPVARDLPLLGDNSVTYLNNGVVQFDWPRVVTVTITGGVPVAGGRVTIFGTDWYGFPLQHTYVLTANSPVTYPTITQSNVAPVVNIPAKTFYTVNRVYIDGAIPGLISLGCADAFGLPYAINTFGDITSIGWGLFSDMTVTPIAGSTVRPIGPFVFADATFPSTGTSGDVRGFYVPSTAANGALNLRFTYYVRGADTWINQVANRQQLYMQQTGLPLPQGVPVAPLTLTDLKGVPQFYTGSPS